MSNGSHRCKFETEALGYLLKYDGLLAASSAPELQDIVRPDWTCQIIP
jgi:hypothetical protein